MIDKVVRDYSADIVNFVTVVPLLQGPSHQRPPQCLQCTSLAVKCC
jgi:hypothetical protein